MVAAPFGGGVIGNTTGSGPVIGGSSPPPRATVALQSPRSAAWGFCLRWHDMLLVVTIWSQRRPGEKGGGW